MDEIPEPNAPPGAGLPLPELMIVRVFYRLRRLTGNRETFNKLFSSERSTIGSLVESCEPQSRAKRVLIQRVRSFEDSSRYWSVLMTLDHQRIVNQSITGLIGALSKGKTPPGKASTAAVKPNLKTKARYNHPWFGSMDASGWHATAAHHLGIHRVQIERILSGLAG
ncbi:MAG: hypothetical protein ABIT37_00740 [Luteolibacter sp.]